MSIKTEILYVSLEQDAFVAHIQPNQSLLLLL